MKVNIRHKWLWLTIIALGLLLIGCFLLWVFIDSASSTLPPEKSALLQTNQLLSAAADNPPGPMPDNLPGYLRVGDECWSLLQENMRKNANQYELAVTSVNDPAKEPYSGYNHTEVWLDIIFPDGQTIRSLYFNGGLAYCCAK